MSLSASILERKKKSRNKYTSHDAVRMVVGNGLNPTEALRACLNPCSQQRLNYLLANGGENESYFKQKHNNTLAVLLGNSFELKKGVPVNLSSPVFNRTQDSAVVSLNSSEGFKPCNRVRK